MKVAEFKRFKELCATVDEKHPIWWSGFAWINLTKRQIDCCIPILLNRGFPVQEVPLGKIVRLPSGIGVFIEKN